MMTTLIDTLDILIVVAALSSAWLWFRSSRRRVRRVSRHEEFNHADLNRVVTALNRTQLLNSRVALATAIAGLFAGFRWLLELFR